MRLTESGYLIGLALAPTSARLMKSFLYSANASNPFTFTGIAVCFARSSSSPAGSSPAAQPRRLDDRVRGRVN